jgi:hypothetical protein
VDPADVDPSSTTDLITDFELKAAMAANDIQTQQKESEEKEKKRKQLKKKIKAKKASGGISV